MCSCFSAACDASSGLGHSSECSIYVLHGALGKSTLIHEMDWSGWVFVNIHIRTAFGIVFVVVCDLGLSWGKVSWGKAAWGMVVWGILMRDLILGTMT